MKYLSVLLLLLAAPSSFAAGPSDRTLSVNGVELHFRIYAGDDRTILLEAGSGLNADTWNETASLLAEATGATVISYDRAGMGSSSLPRDTYDVYEEVARLHAGLYELGRTRQLILVGHSYGGFLIHLFGNLYPEAVIGLVYVDANTALGIDGIGGAAVVAGPRIKANDVPNPTKEQQAGLRLSRAFAATLETVRRYPPLCGVPVAVISSGKYASSVSPAFIAGWRRGHIDLVDRTHGKYFIAQDAGHMVHKDDPGIIRESTALVAAAAGRARPRIGTLSRACEPFDW
ncbi:alpha/beta fold hydrolase [Peristeroidobacter soli]|jgi:pimeloyl-ACP methyl ester carboxylesterase|uniref:alpha/beta fold hydrolase n=1 Tax=Peristeroidobacter soli TaxID=2497877 RepID=UPI00101BEF53|nr:alpha/beta hydrolase [Peristeroidobacter soli]